MEKEEVEEEEVALAGHDHDGAKNASQPANSVLPDHP